MTVQNRMSRAELNATAASLLGFLHRGPMTGWDLAAFAGKSVANFWNLTRSQVYRELKTLEAGGLVEASKPGPRDRRPYRITRAGRAAFAEWIRREPGPDLIRSPLLLTVFFGDHVEPGRLKRFLAAQRVQHERQLEKFRALLTAHGSAMGSAVHTLRFGITFEESVLAWIDSLPWLTS